MAAAPPLPPGFVAGPPPAPASPAPPPLPPGFVAGAPPASADATAAPNDSGWAGVAENAATGLLRGVDNLYGLPHTLADLSASVWEGLGQPHELSDVVAEHTPSPSDVNKMVFGDINAAARAISGSPTSLPYTPQTPEGRVGQAILSAVVPSALGGGGLSALATREAAGLTGSGASELYGQVRPNDPYGRLAAGVVGALAGGGGAAGLSEVTRAVARPLAPNLFAPRTVANELATASGQSGRDLAASIDRNLPEWTPGTQPTLGAVTGNTGIRNLEYNDMASAARAGNPVYQTAARATNAAQRAAIAKVTPDAGQTIRNLTAERDAAVNAIPAGLTAQEAGRQFRQNLQDVLDQRLATRAAGGNAFDALESSPARISLQPVIDYTTGQAAKNAGEVGQAYKRALDQFKSATGITLETPAFANSVLKGLGDLAASYPKGSAAARAVLDVKGRLEASLGDQVPEIAAARAKWAENSRPLDVFETRPFAQVLATDRFGRSYSVPNDAVADAFLRGRGTADSLDALNGVFGDPEASSRALQDYIAGQVRDRALKPDGSIDAQAMQRVLQPYSRALMRFPRLRRQFQTARGAQEALDEQAAYQRLYDLFGRGLGTLEHDAEGNPMYSAAAFDRMVKQNAPLIERAYGPEGARVINRLNDELSSIAQTAYAKVKGQSGTPQAMPGIGARAARHFGELAGSVGGFLLEHAFGGEGAGGAIIGSRLGDFVSNYLGTGRHSVAEVIDSVRRQALTDPAYAKALLQRYSPKMPSSVGKRALEYVLRRTPGFTTPLLTPPQVRGPRMLAPYPAPAQ